MNAEIFDGEQNESPSQSDIIDVKAVYSLEGTMDQIRAKILTQRNEFLKELEAKGYTYSGSEKAA